MAIGYKADPIISSTTPGIKTRSGGLLLADEKTGATDRKGVFTGGDAVSGPRLVSPPELLYSTYESCSLARDRISEDIMEARRIFQVIMAVALLAASFAVTDSVLAGWR